MPTQPGAELMAGVELLEFAHAGGDCRGADFADADHLGRSPGVRAAAHMLADHGVAPMQVLVELAPVVERTLQYQARGGVEFVGGILDHVGQHRTQHLRTLAEDQAELGEHTANAVDAGGLLLLQSFTHAMQTHHALLLAGLDRHEAHRRARGCFADRRGVGHVVLAAAAFHAVGADEVGGNQTRIETHRSQSPRPVMRARGEAKFWLTRDVSMATYTGLSKRQLREAEAEEDAEELLVPFELFPWFKKATIEQLTDVRWPTPNHLHWPQLDADLSVESIRDPSAFPLVSKAAG